MNIYAIHEQKNCHVEYNVVICSTKTIADKQIKKLLKDYDEWKESVKREINKAYPKNDYECSLKTPKFWIEKIKVITK
jgi:hypothetical protein